MDQICGLLRGLQRHIADEVTPTQGPALELEHPYASQLTQINESVYSLPFPEGKCPSVEIVLFHGLQLEGSHGAYTSSWVSRSQSNPELWVKWILEDEKLEDARILFISYDAHFRNTNEVGRMDMRITSENLISDLIDSAEVGQDGCPVILVGHCLGGVLMKELCVQAQDRLEHVQAQDRLERCSQNTINPGVQNFLANVQGFLFYGSPHCGTELAYISTFSKSPLFRDLTALNKDAARRNEAFRELRQKYRWRTFGIGETVPVNMDKFRQGSTMKTSDFCLESLQETESIGARDLSIIWGGDDRYWQWCHRHGSRHFEVAFLKEVCWLEVNGRWQGRLSPGAYTLSWRLCCGEKGYRQGRFYNMGPIEFSFEASGNVRITTGCYLTRLGARTSRQLSEGEQQPLGFRWDADTWMELDVGNFTVESADLPVEITFCMKGIDTVEWKENLYLDGVVICPSWTTHNRISLSTLEDSVIDIDSFDSREIELDSVDGSEIDLDSLDVREIEIRSLLKKAGEMVKILDYERALQYLSPYNLRELEPQHQRLLLGERGIVKRLMGDLHGALEDLTRAAGALSEADDGQDFLYEILRHRGYVNFLLGNLDDAEKDGEMAIYLARKPFFIERSRWSTLGQKSVSYMGFRFGKKLGYKLDKLYELMESAHSQVMEKVIKSNFEGALACWDLVDTGAFTLSHEIFFLQEKGVLMRLAGDLYGALESLTAALEVYGKACNVDGYKGEFDYYGYNCSKHRGYVNFLLGDLERAQYDGLTALKIRQGQLNAEQKSMWELPEFFADQLELPSSLGEEPVEYMGFLMVGRTYPLNGEQLSSRLYMEVGSGDPITCDPLLSPKDKRDVVQSVAHSPSIENQRMKEAVNRRFFPPDVLTEDDEGPAMMNEEYDTVAHKGIPVAETDARKSNVTDIDYESSSIVRTPHKHGRDGKQQNFVKDFITEINRGESRYAVSKAWLVSLDDHDKETVMSVLLRAGYIEFHQTHTTVMYRRIEDNAEVPTVHNQLAACTTEKIDVSSDDIKQSLASNDYGYSDEIGEERYSTKALDGNELGSASQMERSDGLDSEMSTVSSSQKKIHIATVQTDETSRLGSPSSLSHKGNAVVTVSNEKLESFKTALNDTGPYGYAVSTEWLSTLSDHEVEDLKAVLWKAGYLQIGKTNTTTYFKRHGHVHNKTGSQRQAPSTHERNALGDRGRSSTSQCTESDLPEKLQGPNMEATEVTSESQEEQRRHVGCQCLPQYLTVTCQPPPEEASTSSSQRVSKHSTRQSVSDCHVTMPKYREQQIMNTEVDKIINLRKSDFDGKEPCVKLVSLHVRANTRLTCCLTSDQNDKKVRFEFHNIEGAVQTAGSGQMEESTDKKIMPLVLRAVRTNVYAYTTRAEQSSHVPLRFLEPEQFQSIDRKGQTGGHVLKKTAEHPKNHEPGSSTIELQYGGRATDCDVIYGNYELMYSNDLPVVFEGDVPANLNQNPFLELEVRYQLEICHLETSDSLPRKQPFVRLDIVTTPVDFDCMLEFKCKIT